MTDLPDKQAKQAAEEAGEVMPGSHWVETLGKFGYAAKGVVYIVVGILAVRAVYDIGGGSAGPRDALEELAGQPFGMTLLALTGAGLVCYALWRLVLATLDAKNEGSDTKSLLKRSGFAMSGIANLSLSIVAFRIMLGDQDDGPSPQEEWSERFLDVPFGPWLIMAAGAFVVIFGLYHFYRAYKGEFVQKYGSDISQSLEIWALRIGRMGLSARGVAFGLIGLFAIRAGWEHDPDEAGGMGEAFEMLEGTFGTTMLAIVGAGFICYGAYCFFYARYRQFEAHV